MTKKINELDDLANFYEAMKDVKPIRQEKILIKKTAVRKIKTNFIEQTESLSLSTSDYLPLLNGEDLVSYKNESISHKILRNLMKGQYTIDALIDLHGLSVEKASKALTHFLQISYNEKKRIVLIIHGKGHGKEFPLLKNRINHWLREIDLVLAFCSAIPKHGGRGATYVLLKKLKEGKD